MEKKEEQQNCSFVLMNAIDKDELRVITTKSGLLQSIIHERIKPNALHLGNIYKAKVSNIEPSLDAAFLELGGEKNGFLYVKDLVDDGTRIEDALEVGQELLVQITKEPIRDKGPCVTTNISIAGRCLVLTKGLDHNKAISKKITDRSLRTHLKDVLSGLNPPEGFGYILRTAAAEQLDEEISLDHAYLTTLWKEIIACFNRVRAPACVYKEVDVVLKTLRDMVRVNTEKIIIDNERLYDDARAFSQLFMPEIEDKIILHNSDEPIMSAYGIEKRIETTGCNQVELPSGGNIVIEQTEALVSIDINSAKNREASSVEATALLTNLEAAHTIAEQLLLRDLGGIIIIDFIDMENLESQKKIYFALRQALEHDPSRTFVTPVSRFGLVEMTRQRRGPSHRLLASAECPYCGGNGRIKTMESLTIEVMRAIREEFHKNPLKKIEVILPQEAAISLLNARHKEIDKLEEEYDSKIVFTGDVQMKERKFRFNLTKTKGRKNKKHKAVNTALIIPMVSSEARIAKLAREQIKKASKDIEKEISEKDTSSYVKPKPVEVKELPNRISKEVKEVAFEACQEANMLKKLLFAPKDRYFPRKASDMPPFHKAL